MDITSLELIKHLVNPLKKLLNYVKNYGKQIPFEKKEYTSFFINNNLALEKVYEIRDSVFSESEISGRSYDYMIKTNRFAIKVLSKSKKSDDFLGYSSIIPINTNTFNGFIRGEKSHKQVIKESINWSECSGETYLYLVGIVVKKGDWNPLLTGYYLLTDMAVYLDKIMQNKKISGVCGYPSTKEGKNIFENMSSAFYNDGKVIDGIPLQKIYVCDKNRIPILKNEIKEFLDSKLFEKYKENVMWKDKFLFLQSINPGTINP